MNNIFSLANSHHKARESYEKGFRAFFQDEIHLLPENHFWLLMSVFQNIVFFDSKDTSKDPDEFFRKALANHFSFFSQEARERVPECPKYSFMEAVQFAKTWADLKDKLYRPLFDTVEGYGDDGYGDLLDALPLCGETFIKKCLKKGSFADHDEFEGQLKKTLVQFAWGSDTTEREVRNRVCNELSPDKRMFRIVLAGENYFRMRLYEAAQERFVSEVLDSNDQQVIKESCKREPSLAEKCMKDTLDKIAEMVGYKPDEYKEFTGDRLIEILKKRLG